MPEIELKPCPFCGGEAILKEYYNSYSDWWIVSCSECGVSQTGNANEFSYEAAEAWNKRANSHGFSHCSGCAYRAFCEK